MKKDPDHLHFHEVPELVVTEGIDERGVILDPSLAGAHGAPEFGIHREPVGMVDREEHRLRQEPLLNNLPDAIHDRHRELMNETICLYVSGISLLMRRSIFL